jgi:hypothetical protein
MNKLQMLAAVGFLAAAPAFAYDDAGCSTVVWSAEHGHYHCAGGPEVVYTTPPPVAGPRVYVNLAYGYPAYPYYGPRFYAAPVFAFGAPYYRGRYWHHPYHARW